MMQNIKYIFGFIILLAIGYAALQWVRDYQYKHSAGYAASRYYDELQQRYQNDIYGGSTPEETLSLFTDALKKGDIDLASKYFEVKKQDEWLKKFNIAKTNGNLNLYMDEVQKATAGKAIAPDNYLYTVLNKDGVAKYIISLVKNTKTGKWKISEL
ncbi:MAG: hypothetical protein AAB796_01080 [Patescibacteria group bacterium]